MPPVRPTAEPERSVKRSSMNRFVPENESACSGLMDFIPSTLIALEIPVATVRAPRYSSSRVSQSAGRKLLSAAQVIIGSELIRHSDTSFQQMNPRLFRIAPPGMTGSSKIKSSR